MSVTKYAVIMTTRVNKKQETRSVLCSHSDDAHTCLRILKKHYNNDTYRRMLYISRETIYTKSKKDGEIISVSNKTWNFNQCWETLNPGFKDIDIVKQFLKDTDPIQKKNCIRTFFYCFM